MMPWLIKLFIKNSEDISAPSVKKAYAALSSIVGIILNLFLCMAKIMIGFFSNSIAISADGFNNLSDAGTSLMSFVGFRIARYSGGETHPFGHGRIEWIMSIFTSIAVIAMGINLIGSSIAAIRNPKQTIFSVAVIIVLALSILIKFYMWFYNTRFAKITDSSTLKATAADCISDALSTTTVLLSTVISHVTAWKIDGYCGILVSVFIMIAGIKSLWEVLGRIMGKSADQSIINAVLTNVKKHPEIQSIYNLMVHDYGFGYFVVSMRVAGYKKNSEQLYSSINEISYELHKKYHCDCFIQIDYLIDNVPLADKFIQQIHFILQKYSGEININDFRLIENGLGINIIFNLLYPAEMQNKEEEICLSITSELEKSNVHYHTIINGIIRRERFSLHR